MQIETIQCNTKVMETLGKHQMKKNGCITKHLGCIGEFVHNACRGLSWWAISAQSSANRGSSMTLSIVFLLAVRRRSALSNQNMVEKLEENAKTKTRLKEK